MAWLADAHRKNADYAHAREWAVQGLEITTAVTRLALIRGRSAL